MIENVVTVAVDDLRAALIAYIGEDAYTNPDTLPTNDTGLVIRRLIDAINTVPVAFEGPPV